MGKQIVLMISLVGLLVMGMPLWADDAYMGDGCCYDGYLYSDAKVVSPWYGDDMCEGSTCEDADQLAEYLPERCSLDWGKQGPKVIVCDCGSIIPARAEYVDLAKLRDVVASSITCGSTTEDICTPRSNGPYFKGEYPESIFVVNTDNDDFYATVSLTGSDCDTLKKARNAVVELYLQQKESVHLGVEPLWDPYEFCDDPQGGEFWHCGCQQDLESRRKQRVEDYGHVDTVRVVFRPGNFFSKYCSGPGDPSPVPDGSPPSSGPPSGPDGNGGGGCGSGGCGWGGNGSTPQIGVEGAETTVSQDSYRNPHDSDYGSLQNLNCYGSIDAYGYFEVNTDGFWYKAIKRPGWNIWYNNIQYDQDHNATKISLEVTSPTEEKYYYEKNISALDLLKTENEVKAALKGELIPLRYVHKNGVTKRQYQYDSSGRVVTQSNAVGSGSGVMIYDYDSSDPCNIARIWAGTDPTSDYVPWPGQPTGGRWMNITFDSETSALTDVERGCSSCGSAQSTSYSYVDGNVGQYYDADTDTSYPTERLVEKISNAEGVLSSYQYDNYDRFTSHYLGDYSAGGDKVSEWVYLDYDFDADTGSNMLIRKDHVNGSQYRASCYMSDNNERLTAEYRYHDLQDSVDNEFTGGCSVTRYEYDTEVDSVSVAITTLPKGNKTFEGISSQTNEIYGVYDAEGTPIIQGRSKYKTVNGQYEIEWSINPQGKTTNYLYDSDNLTRRYDADPCVPGIVLTDVGRATSRYQYDDDHRLTLEYLQGGASTYYSYDLYDRLTAQIEGYGSATPLTTSYAYNEYNELTATTLPSGLTNKTYYDAVGSVIGQASLSGSDLVSGTAMAYDGNGRLTKRSTVHETDVFSETNFLSDIAGDFASASLDWSHDVYDYDGYGRRTLVINDAGGMNLSTNYEYNNQSEVIKTIDPMGAYSRTERDGRGLVSREITGAISSGYDVDYATVQYYYDLNGNMTQKVDAEGVIEIYDYNRYDQLSRVRKGITSE